MCLIIKHIQKFIPSYIRHLASDILHLTSDIRHLTSDILRIREPPLWAHLHLNSTNFPNAFHGQAVLYASKEAAGTCSLTEPKLQNTQSPSG